MLLGEMIGERPSTAMSSPARRRDAPFDDWILVGVAQCNQVAVQRRRPGKSNVATQRAVSIAASRAQRSRSASASQVGDGGRLVEAADAHVDGVDRAAAEHVQDVVAHLLELQPALDDVAVIPGQLDRALVAEKVGRVEQVDVQHVALDPLAAVEQAAQRPHLRVDGDPAGVLDRLAGTHLVGDRADPADARGDIGQLRVRAPAEECLEEARGLEDAQLHVGDHALPYHDVHTPFAFDPRQRRRPPGCATPLRVGHGVTPWSSRRSRSPRETLGPSALNVRKTRTRSKPDMPLSRSAGDNAWVLVRVGGTEAPVAPAVVRGADRTASRVRHRPEAGNALRHHHADGAATLALHADGMRRDLRPPPGQERGDHLEQLVLVDWAAVELEVNRRCAPREESTVRACGCTRGARTPRT